MPLKIRTNALVSSFLSALSEATPSTTTQSNPALATSSAAIPPSYSRLNLGTANTARNLELVVEALDNYKTEEGNLDWVFNNTPVFFIRDPAKFPHFIHTQKRDPQTHLKDADMFWVGYITSLSAYM